MYTVILNFYKIPTVMNSEQRKNLSDHFQSPFILWNAHFKQWFVHI